MAPARKLVGQEEEVVAAHRAGARYAELAASFDVSPSTIGRVLARAGVQDRRRAGRPSKLSGREEEVVARFREGRRAYEVAAEFGVERTAIRRVLDAAGLHRNSGPWRRPAEIERAMAEEYAAGASLSDVGNMFGFSRSLVKRAVLEQGGALRRPGRRSAR